jgi:hypothetical protein
MAAEPTKPDASQLASDCSEAVAGGKPIPETKPVDIDLLAELRQARKDRVAQIKAEIESGSYDSDELFDAALGRMLNNVSLEDEDEATEPAEEDQK